MKRYDPEQLNNTIVSKEPFVEEKKHNLSGDTMRFTPVSNDTISFEPIRTTPSDFSTGETTRISIPDAAAKSRRSEAPPLDSSAPARKKQKQKISAAEKAAKIRMEPPAALPSAQELLEKYHSGLFLQHVRLAVLILLALFGLLHMIYQTFGLTFLPFVDPIGPWLSILIMLLSALLAVEVPVRGVLDLIHLRISTHTVAVFAAILALIHALLTLSSKSMNYCEAVALILLFQYRSLLSGRSGLFHTLHAVCSFESPMGIFDAPQLLPNTDSLRRDSADMDDFIRNLTQTDRPQKVLSVYATVLLPLTLALACLFSVKTSTDFLQLWLLMLLCSIPCSGAQAFTQPFRVLAKRLSGFGGALCGWHSAMVFGRKHTIILRDEDLFPSAGISSNGMKLFNSYDAGRVTAYALAALEIAGSPLADLFRSLLKNQYTRAYPVTDHRFYNNSGVGIEIAGDIVLVGPLNFMKSMGVHMPSGTRVRQAVYVSINGELAGIFAIKYKSNSSTRSGLKDVLANRNFSVVLATRDFLISPELIAAKYELPTDTMVYPVYPERLRLSEIDPNEKHSQGALIAKDTFGAFATTVAAGRTLRSTAQTVLAMSIFAGLLGLSVCIVLMVWSAAAAVSPLHVATFQLLWSAVTAFVSNILLKF